MEPPVLLLLLIIPGSFGGPLAGSWSSYGRPDSTTCASHCTGASKFQYQVGKTYHYNYDVKTSTSMNGVGSGAAKMEVKARVNIHVLSKCELALSLEDVWLKSSSPDSSELSAVEDWQYKMDLERNILRFSFQDGKVEDVCPVEEDSVVSVNFKRGVLSAFQNSMNQHEQDESLREVDVTGSCPTMYRVVQKGWESKQIEKEKDLLGCSDRHNYKTIVRSTPFTLPDTIQSLPLLKGSHKCSHTVSSQGHILATICEESLVFRPFSNRDAGASTKTVQKMSYISSTNNNIRQGTIFSKTTLLYEHSSQSARDDLTLWSAKEKLSELCELTVQKIPSQAAGRFTEMVYLMRGLDSQEIMDIAERVQRGNICQDNRDKARKFFMDALPMIGTAASVDVMVDMLLEGNVNEIEKDTWIISFNFIHDPNLDLIANLRRLLLSKKLRSSALLPVTSVVNNYCRNDPHCANKQQVKDILNILEDLLGQDCSGKDKHLMLLALRATANLGHSDQLVTTLGECVQSSHNSMVVRVTAVQAFKAVSCSTNRQVIMDTFMNKDEDSELRINAYLSVMTCPSEVILSEVRKSLENESVNQVGSFVWTHLTNLMTSSTPYKQALRDILEDDTLLKEFNMDRRKFSRNYELGFFSDRFGAGAGGESNIIFSSKSFLPRSVMLNLTVDMLGHSVNLLELGGRAEGLELLIKRYMGPGGLFESQNKKVSRCVHKEKMDHMKSKFAVEEDEMTASFYMKMFGNELSFQHLNENDMINLKDKMTMKNILASLARGDDISFTKSALFLDSTMTVPTVAGMALHLSVNGSATVELVAKGKMDFRHVAQKRMQANLDIKPSGAVELSGFMSLESGASKAGLKMVTTLHSSTAISGSLDLINGQVLTMDFDTPKEKMEIIDIKSELFLVHNEVLEKHKPRPEEEVKREACPLLQISALQGLGYELCGHVAFIKPVSRESSPYFPFTGPTSLSLILFKKDAPKGFKLVGKHIKNAETAVGQLSFDAPGSKGDRAINLGYFLDGKAKSAELEFNSPWKKIIAKGSYNIEPKTHMFSATVRSDGKEYLLKLQVDIEKNGQKTVFKPNFELSRPEDSELLRKAPVKATVDGFVSIDWDFEEMETEINFNSGLKPDPIKLNAKYINKKRQKSIFGSVTLNKNAIYSGTVQVATNTVAKKTMSGQIEPTILISAPNWRIFLLSGNMAFKENKLLKGNLRVSMDKTMRKPMQFSWILTKQSKKTTSRVRVTASIKSMYCLVKSRGSFTVPADASSLGQRGNLLLGKVTTDYTIPSQRSNKIVVSSRVLDRSTKSLKKYRVNFNMHNKKDPKQNIVASGDFEHKETYTKALITMGQGPKSRVKDISLGMSLTHKINPKMALVQYSIKFLNPKHKMEYQVEGKHEHHLGHRFWFETYSSTIFAKGKSVELRVNGKDNSKNGNLNAVGSLELSYPNFQVKNVKIEGKSYKIKTSIEKNPQKEFVHTVSLQTKESVKHSLVTTYKLSPKNVFSIHSEMQVQGDLPITLILSAKNDRKTTSGEVDLRFDNKQYRFETINERKTEKYHLTTLDVTTPSRQVKLMVEGGLAASNELVLKCKTQWDAKRDPHQAIAGKITYAYDNAKTGGRNQLEIEVTTPFEGNEIYKYSRHVHYRQKHIEDRMLMIVGSIDTKYAYALEIILPLPKEILKLEFSLNTPFEQLKEFSVLIKHKFGGSKTLSTTFSGKYNEHSLATELSFRNNGIKRQIETSFNIKSTVPEIKIVKLRFHHRDDGSQFSSKAEIQINKKKFEASLTTHYLRVHYQVQIESTLKISLSRTQPIILKLVHTNTLTHLNATLSLDWKPKYSCKLILGGKSSKAENDHALEYEFIGPWKQLQHMEGRYRFTNQFGVIRYETYSRLNKDPQKVYHDVYKYSDKQFEMTSRRGDQNATLIAKYAQFPYTLYLRSTWTNQEQPWRTNQEQQMRQKEILLEGSIDENTKDGWSTTAKLTTSFEHVRNVDLQANLEKGKMSEWEMNALLSFDVRKQITAIFTVDVESMSKVSGQIKTPFKEMTEFNFGFEQKNTKNSVESLTYMEMQPVFNKVKMEQFIKLKPKYEGRIYLDLPDTDFKSIEINAESIKHRKRTNSKVTVKYHFDKEIALHLKTHVAPQKFPENTKLHFDLKTPFDVLPSMSLTTTVNKRNEKWIGNFDLKTAAEELQYLNLNMIHSSSKNSCHNDINIASSVFETVTMGMHYDWGQLKGINMSLNSPSIGHTNIGFKHNTASWTNFHNKLFFDVNGYELDLDVGIEHNQDQTEVLMAYVLPGSNHSYIKASVHRFGKSFDDFDIGGFLKVGKLSRPYNVSMQFSNIPNKYALGTTLETPYTKALSYLLKSEIEAGQYRSVIYSKYGKRFLFDSVARHKRSDKSFDHRSETTFKLNEEVTHTVTDVKLKFVKTGEEAEFEHILNDHWIKSSLIRKIISEGEQDKHSLEVDITTSFEDFSDIGLEAQVDSESGKHDGKVILEYMDEKEAVLTFDLSRERRHKTILNAELTLPVDGYDKNTLTYSQVSKKHLFKADSELITGKGEHLSGKLLFQNKDFTLTLNGPIEDFESLSISANYDKDTVRITGESALKLSLNPNPAKLEFDVHADNIQPLLMKFKLRSPYKNLGMVDLTVKHNGKQWNEFTTNSVLNSKELGKVKADFGWKFDSVNNLNGRASVISTIDSGADLKLALKTEQTSSNSPMTSHATIGWAKDKAVTIDHTWTLSEGRRKSRLSSELGLSTPFEKLQSAEVKIIHIHGSGIISESLDIHHNGKHYIDADLNYEYVTQHMCTLKVEKPRPMLYSFMASTSDDIIDSSLKLNWDKRDRDSQVEITTNLKDRSEKDSIDQAFKVMVSHPVRTMGVDISYLHRQDKLQTAGELTWHKQKEKTISYDFGRSWKMSETWRQEVHAKIGIPHRSVRVECSNTNSSNAWSTRSALLWDADNDQDKKVELSTTVKEYVRQREVNINLNLPSIDREMNVGVTSKRATGEVLHDSKVEISYSDNPLKTITITNKLNNGFIASDKFYNYTAEFGLEHPITDINIQTVSHIGHADGVKSTGMFASFVTASGTKETVNMLASVDYRRNFMEFLVSTPFKSVRLEGEQDRSEKRTQTTWRSYEDGKPSMKADLLLDHFRRTLTLEFNYDQDDSDKMISLNGRLINESAFQMDLVSYQNRHEYTTETMMAVRLNSSNVLHTRILWRPQLFSELQNYIGARVTEFSYDSNNMFGQAIRSLGSEVKAKYTLMSRELRDELDDVFKLLETEMEQLSIQLEALRIQVRRSYQRNDLHIRDMGQQAQDTFEEILSEMSERIRSYHNYYLAITQTSDAWMENIRNYPIGQEYQSTINKLMASLKVVREALEEALNKLVIEAQQFSTISYRQYLQISRSIDRKLNSYAHAMHQLPMYRKMVEQREELARLGKNIVPNWAHAYDKIYLQAQEMLFAQFHDMMNRPEFRYMHSVSSEVHQQLMYYSKEGGFDLAMERLVDLSKNLVLMELIKLKNSITDMHKSRVIVYDTKRGELQFELNLPVTMKSLVDPAEFRAEKYLKTIKSWTRNILPTGGKFTSMWDMYYDYVPSLEQSQMLPPFKASAYLIGSQHILTFDQQPLTFLSQCSHVLARDLLKDSFSITVNYYRHAQKDGIRSLCLTFDNSLHMEVATDYKLEINGKDMEMPYLSERVQVYREGDVIRIVYAGGVEIICNPSIQLYKVTIDGWFHGQVDGLMGTYDNEPGNDMLSEKKSSDLEVGRRSCRTGNVAVQHDPTLDADNLCIKQFMDTASKFKPWFGQVNPKPFLRVCQVYMGTMSPKEAIRLVTEQYRTVCQGKGVYIGSLREFSPCGKEDKIEIDHRHPLYQSADVVFVLEDTTCNNWAQSSLAPMVSEINKALETAGMKENRFGLEGYGGESSFEGYTVRTINGQMFGEASLFLRAVETLRLSESSRPLDIKTAVQKAMEYPFRTGVAKVLVVAPCSVCEVGFLEKNLADILHEKGFNVHVLQQQQFTLQDTDSSAARYNIYGLDNSKTFTNLISDSSVTPLDVYNSRPQDYCNQMAQATNGSVFDTIHLSKSPSTRRQFIKSFASRVGWDTKLPACQTCDCNAETGRMECQLCQSNGIFENYLSPLMPWPPKSLSHAVGGLHNLDYEVKNSLGYLS